MPLYNVQIARTSIRRVWRGLEAESKPEARLRALDMAGNINFFEGTEDSSPEYAVEEVQETADAERQEKPSPPTIEPGE